MNSPFPPLWPCSRYPGSCLRGKESVTLSLADARRLPPSNGQRLCCRFYDAPPRLLPNGLPRTTPLVADALLEIGGTFLVTARILRVGPDQPPSRLQLEREAWDTATGRIVLMPPYAPSLIRAAYDVLAARQVLVNARRHAHGLGRN